MSLTSHIRDHALLMSNMVGSMSEIPVFEMEYLVSIHNDWFRSIDEDRKSSSRSSIRQVKSLSESQLEWLKFAGLFIAMVDAYESANLVTIAGASALRTRFATMNGGKVQIENRHNAARRFIDGKSEMSIDDAASFLKSEVTP